MAKYKPILPFDPIGEMVASQMSSGDDGGNDAAVMVQLQAMQRKIAEIDNQIQQIQFNQQVQALQKDIAAARTENAELRAGAVGNQQVAERPGNGAQKPCHVSNHSAHHGRGGVSSV